MKFKSFNWLLIIISALSISIISNLVMILVAIRLDRQNYFVDSGGAHILDKGALYTLVACLIFGVVVYFYSKSYKLLQAFISVIFTVTLSFIILSQITARLDVVDRLENPCESESNYSPGRCGD